MSEILPQVPLSADEMLKTMLANLAGMKPAKAPAKPKKAAEPIPLTVTQAWNVEHSGYINWVAEARVVQIEEQECTCCGHVNKIVRAELYRFSHAASKSVWLRPEGYGVEHGEDLPIFYDDLPRRTVSACAACRIPGFNFAIQATGRNKQYELPL